MKDPHIDAVPPMGIESPPSSVANRVRRLCALLLVVTLIPALRVGDASGSVEEAGWLLARTSDDGTVRVYERDNSAGYREFRGVSSRPR